MPANDQFSTFGAGITSPAENAAAITPSNSVDLDYVTRAIYVGGAGNLAVVMKGGDTVTFFGAVAGSVIPIRAARVLATGTTATSLVGLR